jgi:F0F1-type ATP synthase membrane subunit c/vacuolar-type H+-ATPase subunit K
VLILSEVSDLKLKYALLIMLLPILAMSVAGVAFALTVTPVQSSTTAGPYDTIGLAIASGLAVGMSGLGAGLAISAVGSAAVSALAEKPETFFRSFLIVALAEALAIYGLIMGILLWLKIA